MGLNNEFLFRVLQTFSIIFLIIKKIKQSKISIITSSNNMKSYANFFVIKYIKIIHCF